MGFPSSKPPVGVKVVIVGEGKGLDMGPGTSTTRRPAPVSNPKEGQTGGPKEK